MKAHLQTLFALVAIAVFSSCGSGGKNLGSDSAHNAVNNDAFIIKNSTPEELAQSVLYCILEHDEKSYASLFITKDELLSIINSAGTTDTEKREWINEVDAKIALLKMAPGGDLTFAKSDMDSKGLLTDNVTVTAVDKIPTDFYGTKQLNLIIHINAGLPYLVRCYPVVKTSHGYKLAGAMDTRDPSEPTDPTDSMNMYLDTLSGTLIQ